MAVDVPLNGHGQNDAEDIEDAAVLASARKKLDEISRGEGMYSVSKTEIGLLKQMLRAPEKADAFSQIVQACDFLDVDEANNELDAFYEAIRLGMSTEYNISHALSRASINRRGAHNSSRVGALLDAMSHQKFTTNQPRGKDGNSNPRSPIA